DQEDALGNLGAEPLKLLRAAQELDHFLKLPLGGRHVGHVLKSGPHLALLVALGGAFDIVAQKPAAQRVTKTRQKEEEKDRQKDQSGQQQHEEGSNPRPMLFLRAVIDLGLGEFFRYAATASFRLGNEGGNDLAADLAFQLVAELGV